MANLISSPKFTKSLFIICVALATIASIGLLFAPIFSTLYSAIKYIPYIMLIILMIAYWNTYFSLLTEKKTKIISILRSVSLLGIMLLGFTLMYEVTRYTAFLFEAISMFKTTIVYLLVYLLSQFMLGLLLIPFLLTPASIKLISKIEEHPIINYSKIISLCLIFISAIIYVSLET